MVQFLARRLGLLEAPRLHCLGALKTLHAGAQRHERLRTHAGLQNLGGAFFHVFMVLDLDLTSSTIANAG